MDWTTLEALATTTGIVDHPTTGKLHIDPLMGADGRVNALLIRAEPSTKSPSTVPPPASTKWGKGLHGLVGRDVGTRSAVDLALRFARTSLPMLITSEEGSGAAIVARGIHDASLRAPGPFVHVPAGSLARSAMESVLFGTTPHPASGGLLFVEDVHELDPNIQRRLARELDRGTLADVHFVSSALPDVRERVQKNTFSRELYTLVRGSTVALPPLREREDLLDLIKTTLGDLGSPDVSLTEPVIEALTSYSWPGNLRELWACLEHAIVVAGKGNQIKKEHLPQAIHSAPQGDSVGMRLAAERTVVDQALKRTNGNVSAAAKRLGVARSTLYRLMLRHGIAK